MDNEKPAKPAKYFCSNCVFITNNKYNYEEHFLTRKHQRNVAKIKADNGSPAKPAVPSEGTLDNSQKSTSKSFVCCCGRKYLYSSGLSKHRKTCKEKDQQLQNGFICNQELVMYLMKENKEFKEMLIEQNAKIMEMAKEGKVINNTNNNINNINNKFNMNVFLNEKCANALNIMDFVNQLNLQLADLEAVGQLGYVDGLSKIFLRELKELDVTQRPIHCSDLKREVMYIKDNNEWSKDDEQKTKMKKVIDQVSGKNLKQITEWQDKNPDFRDGKSKNNEKFMTILNKCCISSDNEENEKHYNKIIKNVAKEVLVDKS
jgi:hypothetical protein